jgi:hypothetical protein
MEKRSERGDVGPRYGITRVTVGRKKFGAGGSDNYRARIYRAVQPAFFMQSPKTVSHFGRVLQSVAQRQRPVGEPLGKGLLLIAVQISAFG